MESQTKQLKLTVEMAKEIYGNASDELQKVLEANFTQKELGVDNRPKSWEDLGEIDGYWGTITNTIRYSEAQYLSQANIDIAPTREDVNSNLARCQLLQLARAMNSGEVNKYWIYKNESYCVLPRVEHKHARQVKIVIEYTGHAKCMANAPLFKRQEDAEFSIKHHRELWLQYFMLDEEDVI